MRAPRNVRITKRPSAAQVLINYPRIGSYSQLSSNGSPLSSGGVLNMDEINTQAQYDAVIVDPPLTATEDPGALYPGKNLEAVTLLRQTMRARPGTIMLAFCPTGKFFVCNAGWFGAPDPPVPGCNVTSFAYHRYEVIKAYDACIRGTNPVYAPNNYFLGGGYIDYTIPGFPDAFANQLLALVDFSIFDGIFCDEAVYNMLWLEGDGDNIDYGYSGFGSLDAWDEAYQAGLIAFFQRLRDGMGNNRYLIGNGGQLHPSFMNGWMRENFPDQNGASWATNMFGLGVPGYPDTGYLGNSSEDQAPQLSWLTAWGDGTGNQSANNLREARFALGSAALANGIGCLPWSSGDMSRGRAFWLDEFSIRPDGAPDTTGAHRGWLGQPIEAPSDVGNGMYKREFTKGMVLVNPNFAPRTFTLPSPFIYAVTGLSANPTALCPAGDAKFLVKV